ncbi:MAG: DNA polymerase III subunit beta [Patescibacteria group bacterium]
MKFTCTQENLVQGLSIVSHISGKSVNLPILGNVLLKTEGGNLKLSATNLEIAVSTLVRGKVEVDGECTVPAKLFLDYISLLPQGKVNLEYLEEGLRVEAQGQETIIRGMNSQEFPLIPRLAKSKTASCKAADVRRAILQVVFAASTSESRPELSGVACYFGGVAGQGNTAFAATDGYRLAERVIPFTGSAFDSVIIVPSRTMLEASRILTSYKDELGVPEDVEWALAENQLVMTYGNTELVSRLIEGAFPDYRNFIPSQFKSESLVDRSEIQKAVKSAALFSRQGFYDVHLHVSASDSSVSIHSADQGTGKTQSVIPAAVTGEDAELVVNFKYLSDALSALSTAKIKMNMNDAMSPMLVLPESGDEQYRCLVMPIRN